MASVAADVMARDFTFVDCDVTVAEAEEYFESGQLGGLPVLNPDRTVFGVLTPQNLVAFHRRDTSNPRSVRVWEICDARPLVAKPNTPLDEIAEAVLLTSGRHVLVVNEERQLVGLITSDMLVRHYALAEDTVTTLEQAAANQVLNGSNRRPS